MCKLLLARAPLNFAAALFNRREKVYICAFRISNKNERRTI